MIYKILDLYIMIDCMQETKKLVSRVMRKCLMSILKKYVYLYHLALAQYLLKVGSQQQWGCDIRLEMRVC